MSSPGFPSESDANSTVVDQAHSPKNRWSLNQQAFDKLLGSFSSDREQAGIQYEITRRKLVRFFEWRSVELADERADETMNRVARRIEEGQVIENLNNYVYGVARIVFMEALKERERSPIALDDAPQSLNQKTLEEKEPDVRLRCFDDCLEKLAPENKQLILDYYQEERRAKIELRHQLADRLQIPINALRIRAHRIRMSLEKCITTCVGSSVNVK